jgi:hypothetical protein
MARPMLRGGVALVTSPESGSLARDAYYPGTSRRALVPSLQGRVRAPQIQRHGAHRSETDLVSRHPAQRVWQPLWPQPRGGYVAEKLDRRVVISSNRSSDAGAAVEVPARSARGLRHKRYVRKWQQRFPVQGEHAKRLRLRFETELALSTTSRPGWPSTTVRSVVVVPRSQLTDRLIRPCS